MKIQTVKFHCMSCETEGKISFTTQDDTLSKADVAYCPMCAHDIAENNDNEFEEQEQDE
jgi:uncharacterized paraquat-inducible protein A